MTEKAFYFAGGVVAAFTYAAIRREWPMQRFLPAWSKALLIFCAIGVLGDVVSWYLP